MAKRFVLIAICLMLAATCWGVDSPVTDNVTIHVQGKIAEEYPLDIELSGIGPSFVYKSAVSRDVFEGILSKDKDGKLILDYSIGSIIPVSGGKGTEFREFVLRGKVVVTYGEKFKIGTINGNDFILTVTKYADSKK